VCSQQGPRYALRRVCSSGCEKEAFSLGKEKGPNLTDIIDGRLALAGRTIPLAAPVRVRLTAWLDHRGRVWPATINPHLFVTKRTAPRLLPVGRQFPWNRTQLSPQALREDRILHEFHANCGDVRSICDLFGLSMGTAMR